MWSGVATVANSLFPKQMFHHQRRRVGAASSKETESKQFSCFIN